MENCKMINLERVEYIWKEIQEKKTVYVSQLSQKYFVSPSTIRRDMAELEKQGLVRRTYGGCVLLERESSEIPFLLRKNENQEAKDIICRQAAGLVKDEMYLAIDNTTTAASMVGPVSVRKNLKIVTTSAQTALNCLDRLSGENMKVYCTGGLLDKISRGFTGETACRAMEEHFMDCLFLSCRAVSCDRGLMDVNEQDVYLKRTMIKNARLRVLLADSTKFDCYSYRAVCGWDEIDYLITEKEPAQAGRWRETMEKHGVRLVYPGGE